MPKVPEGWSAGEAFVTGDSLHEIGHARPHKLGLGGLILVGLARIGEDMPGPRVVEHLDGGTSRFDRGHHRVDAFLFPERIVESVMDLRRCPTRPCHINLGRIEGPESMTTPRTPSRLAATYSAIRRRWRTRP